MVKHYDMLLADLRAGNIPNAENIDSISDSLEDEGVNVAEVLANHDIQPYQIMQDFVGLSRHLVDSSYLKQHIRYIRRTKNKRASLNSIIADIAADLIEKANVTPNADYYYWRILQSEQAPLELNTLHNEELQLFYASVLLAAIELVNLVAYKHLSTKLYLHAKIVYKKELDKLRELVLGKNLYLQCSFGGKVRSIGKVTDQMLEKRAQVLDQFDVLKSCTAADVSALCQLKKVIRDPQTGLCKTSDEADVLNDELLSLTNFQRLESLQAQIEARSKEINSRPKRCSPKILLCNNNEDQARLTKYEAIEQSCNDMHLNPLYEACKSDIGDEDIFYIVATNETNQRKVDFFCGSMKVTKPQHAYYVYINELASRQNLSPGNMLFYKNTGPMLLDKLVTYMQQENKKNVEYPRLFYVLESLEEAETFYVRQGLINFTSDLDSSLSLLRDKYYYFDVTTDNTNIKFFNLFTSIRRHDKVAFTNSLNDLTPSIAYLYKQDKYLIASIVRGLVSHQATELYGIFANFLAKAIVINFTAEKQYDKLHNIVRGIDDIVTLLYDGERTYEYEDLYQRFYFNYPPYSVMNEKDAWADFIGESDLDSSFNATSSEAEDSSSEDSSSEDSSSEEEDSEEEDSEEEEDEELAMLSKRATPVGARSRITFYSAATPSPLPLSPTALDALGRDSDVQTSPVASSSPIQSMPIIPFTSNRKLRLSNLRPSTKQSKQ